MTGPGRLRAHTPLHVVAYTDARVRGGAEISLGNLLAHLGNHVQVTVMGVDRPVVDWLVSQRPGSEAVLVPPIRHKADLSAMWQHRAEVARRRPDVFHANLTSMWSCQLALLSASSVRGVRLVAVEQLPLAPRGWARLALKRLVSRRLHAHVGVGDRAAREVEQQAGLPAGSLQVIHNGVPEHAPGAPPVSASAGSRGYSDGPVLGCLARLDHQKGLDVLVRVLARLPGATLVLVGDGPERVPLESLAAELGVSPRLRLLGWTNDARQLLGTFDVFVLPSRFEGFPLAIVEAMLAERPVVASRVGSIPEAVIDGLTGVLVPPDDAEATARAIERLLGDPAVRAEMGRNGRQLALERFTSAAMAARFEVLYDQLLADRS